MQIAGEICQFCEQPVGSESEAAVCRNCETPSHKRCLENAGWICAACGELISPSTGNDSPTETPLLLKEGTFRRQNISARYRLSLVAVAIGMILLPMMYLAIVALFAAAVFYYAIHSYSTLLSGNYNMAGVVIVFFFYLVPLFVGLWLIFFLVKPLFAPRRPPPEAFSLNHADAPKLFTLIGWICRSLNAPIPSRIDLDCSVNAGAGLRSGWRSLFSNDIVLSIGLPLAAGMNLSQFAGVIAHEYGHFSQGAAMRAHYLIRRINEWFYRVVYEQDDWDLYLIRACEAEGQDWRLVLAFSLVRAGIGVGRGLLWGLMVAGNLVSSFMARQMEFDADQYEFKMSGSETFVSTILRLQQLNLGLAAAERQLVAKWKKEKKLFDQIPDFIVSRANEISAETQERHYAQVFKRRTRLFDSHPSDTLRWQRARAAREPGVFHDTAPATSLFADYPELSRRLTLFFYRDLLGPGFSEASLISTEQNRLQTEHDYAADRANIRRHFLGITSDSRMLVIPENKTTAFRRQDTLTAEIQAGRQQMREFLPRVQIAWADFTHAEKNLWQAEQAAQLLVAGFQFEPADFGLTDGNAEAAEIIALETLATVEAELKSFEDLGKMRLANAVQLLPLMAPVIPHAARLRDEAREMMFVLSRLSEIFEPLKELRRDCATLEVLLQYRRNQPAADNTTATLENLCTEIQERVNTIQEHTAQIRYPFHHATEELRVSEYARNKEYHADPSELVLREGKSHTEKLLNLYYRLLGNLVVICSEVEQRLGDASTEN